MSVVDVLERATIPFPELLKGDEVEGMLTYISEQAGFEIRYDSTKKMKIGDAYSADEKNTDIYEIGAELKGSILRTDTHALEYFELEREFPRDEEDDYSSNYFSGLKFSPIPGYELGEHRDEMVQLWDIVRELVNAYCAKRRK